MLDHHICSKGIMTSKFGSKDMILWKRGSSSVSTHAYLMRQMLSLYQTWIKIKVYIEEVPILSAEKLKKVPKSQVVVDIVGANC